MFLIFLSSQHRFVRNIIISLQVAEDNFLQRNPAAENRSFPGTPEESSSSPSQGTAPEDYQNQQLYQDLFLLRFSVANLRKHNKVKSYFKIFNHVSSKNTKYIHIYKRHFL